MDRSVLEKAWDETWTKVTWVAPWSKAVGDLTPEQASWRPGPGRHSIWQIVNHVCNWREHVLSRWGGREGPVRDEVIARNFEEPAAASAEAWRATLDRLHRTHEAMRALVTEPAAPSEGLLHHFGHDCYHLGQIMYLRAMQGLEPIE